MKMADLKVLSDDEIEQIHQASLDILTTCGVKVDNRGMLEFLAGKGLPVDRDQQIVRFTKTCIEEALSHVPSRFEVFDREGNPAFILGDGVPKIAAGHNAIFWVDLPRR